MYFKVVVTEELLVHSVCIGIDGSQEHSNGQRHTHLLYTHKPNISSRIVSSEIEINATKITSFCRRLIVDE